VAPCLCMARHGSWAWPLLQETLRSLRDAHGCANAASAATAMDGGRYASMDGGGRGNAGAIAESNAGTVAEMRKSGLCVGCS
jgi:hypothetical protein